METSLRFNEGKSEVHYMLFYKKFAEALAKIQSQGAIKYGYANWMSGGKPDTEYLNSGMRHLLDFFSGNMYDEDLGTLHLAQACWNFINLLELNYSEWDILDPNFDQEAFEEKWKNAPKRSESPNVMERAANVFIQSEQGGNPEGVLPFGVQAGDI